MMANCSSETGVSSWGAGSTFLRLVFSKATADVAEPGAEQHELRGFRPASRRHHALTRPGRADESDRRKAAQTNRACRDFAHVDRALTLIGREGAISVVQPGARRRRQTLPAKPSRCPAARLAVTGAVAHARQAPRDRHGRRSRRARTVP